jgi:diguanylate cyclase (GGDEF)-like protein
MEESLAQELARATRANYPVSLLKLAIDNFRRFNEAFGREGCDLLLKQLASLIQGQVRRGDVFCRLGGEKFVLILPNAKPEFAVKRAQGLKQSVKNLNLAFQGLPLGPVTVSIGIAGYPDHGPNTEELLRRADQALSDAKSKGRDLVEFAGTVANKG